MLLILSPVLFPFQSMTLKEACKSALTILKQVMEEKLNSTNVEVSLFILDNLKKFFYPSSTWYFWSVSLVMLYFIFMVTHIHLR